MAPVLDPPVLVAGGLAAVGAAGACYCCRRQNPRWVEDAGSDHEGEELGFAAPAAAVHATREVTLPQPAAQPTKQSRIDDLAERLLMKERRMEEDEERRRQEEAERASAARGAAPSAAPTTNASSPSSVGPLTSREGSSEAGERPTAGAASPPSVRRAKHTCERPAGFIEREGRTLVSQLHPGRRRPASDFPSPLPEGETPPEEEALWANPAVDEWNHRRRDGTRWAWNQFTAVDARGQLISVQHEYTHPPTGLRVVLIPMLRLADAQFFDSVAEECKERKALVLAENMHGEEEHPHILEEEKRANSLERPADTDPAQVRQLALLHGRARPFLYTCQQVGSGCVALQYFHVLLSQYCRWRLGDPALSDKSMEVISGDVNTREAFDHLCKERERHLFSCIDNVLTEAADPEWKSPDGARVLALPWNGRHCMRIERFLVQCRGMQPHPEVSVRRIIFDAAQTANMVREANREDDQTTQQTAAAAGDADSAKDDAEAEPEDQVSPLSPTSPDEQSPAQAADARPASPDEQQRLETEDSPRPASPEQRAAQAEADSGDVESQGEPAGTARGSS